MDGFQYLLSKVLPPFISPTMPSERIYWLYLGSALIIAFVVYFATYASKRAGLIKGFIAYCFPKNVFAHKSAIVDYKYFLINKITFAVLFAPLIIGSSYGEREGTADNLGNILRTLPLPETVEHWSLAPLRSGRSIYVAFTSTPNGTPVPSRTHGRRERKPGKIILEMPAQNREDAKRGQDVEPDARR